MNKQKLRPYLIRLLVVSVISLVGVAAFNEFSYLTQKENYDRGPMTVQLVIPAGAAEKVQAGETVAEIPEEMVFVVGDVLEVVNQDAVSHQLGSIWVPAGGTAKLNLDRSEEFAYTCSFQNTNYLGFDVRPPIDLSTRVTGLLLATPTTAVLLYMYSLLIYPLEPKPKVKTPSGTMVVGDGEPVPEPSANGTHGRSH